MKARLIRDMPKLERRPGRKPVRVPNGHPAGTVIDSPIAYLLVRQGVAEAADEECETAADITQERFELAKKAYERASKGVVPEDFDAYKRGLMVGYKPDGKEGDSWIPGPNWTAGCEADYYDNDEEDQDDDE